MRLDMRALRDDEAEKINPASLDEPIQLGVRHGQLRATEVLAVPICTTSRHKQRATPKLFQRKYNGMKQLPSLFRAKI